MPRLEKVVIYTPAEKAFTPMELHRLGYGLYTYPVRLLIRSPYDTTATYSQDVNQTYLFFFFFVSPYFSPLSVCISFSLTTLKSLQMVTSLFTATGGWSSHGNYDELSGLQAPLDGVTGKSSSCMPHW